MCCGLGFLGQGFTVKNLGHGRERYGRKFELDRIQPREEIENETGISGFFFVMFIAFVFGLAGCQQEGTAEKAGQKIDQAAESAGKKVEKASEAVITKAEKAAENMDDAAITALIKAEILSDPLSRCPRSK